MYNNIWFTLLCKFWLQKNFHPTWTQQSPLNYTLHLNRMEMSSRYVYTTHYTSATCTIIYIVCTVQMYMYYTQYTVTVYYFDIRIGICTVYVCVMINQWCTKLFTLYCIVGPIQSTSYSSKEPHIIRGKATRTERSLRVEKEDDLSPQPPPIGSQTH